MKHNWMVFLRAVNVGGKNLVPMVRLKQLLENEGYRSVITYLQSGNVIFYTDNQDQKVIEKQISQLIFANFSVSVDVFASSVESIQQWMEENPFQDPELFPGDKVGIALLSQLPEEENLTKLYAITSTPDKFLVKGSILYLYCPEGFGKTRFTGAMIESKLKVRITVRNRKTIEALSRLVSDNL